MTKRKGVGKVIGRAATGPLSLGVLGGAVVGAVALASWPIAALGGAAYAALVASDVADRGFRDRVLRGRGKPRMPKPSELTDPSIRYEVEQIIAARAEIAAVTKTTPERVLRNIRAALTSLDELELHGATLATRGEQLAKYLGSVDHDELASDVEMMGRRSRAATDPGVRQGYQQAASAAAERHQAVRDIVTAHERVVANLTRIATTFKAVPAKLVRLRALDDQASDSLGGDFTAELDRMNVDMRSFEQTLQSIVEAP